MRSSPLPGALHRCQRGTNDRKRHTIRGVELAVQEDAGRWKSGLHPIRPSHWASGQAQAAGRMVEFKHAMNRTSHPLVPQRFGRAAVLREIIGTRFAYIPYQRFWLGLRPGTEGWSMHPLRVSAQFAAFLGFLRNHPDVSCKQAGSFSRTHWTEFLPAAPDGLSKLLLTIGRGVRKGPQPRRGKRSMAQPAGVSSPP